MKYTKDGVVEDITPEQVKKYEAHGWTQVDGDGTQVVDEIIRLKPPVKTRATVKTLEDIKQQQGDE